MATKTERIYGILIRPQIARLTLSVKDHQTRMTMRQVVIVYSQTLWSDLDFLSCGTTWLDKKDKYQRSIQIELQRAKCYHVVAHLNYRQSPTNSRSRKEFAKAQRMTRPAVMCIAQKHMIRMVFSVTLCVSDAGKIWRFLSRIWSEVSGGWRLTSDPSRSGNVQKTGKGLKKFFQ